MSGHKAASRAVLHLTLLTCVGIFLFPFVWMVGTSLKTDEELNAPGLFPALPVYRRQSPYVKAEVDPVRPEQVSIERWEELLPALRESALKKVPITEIEHRSSAASVLLNVATQRMGASAWEGSEPQVMHAFEQTLSQDLVDAAVSESLASVELYDLQIRTLDARIFKIADEPRIESGQACVTDKRLSYRFESDAPIVLRYEFQFPVEPAEMHKLMLSLKPDDSWHRVTASLEVGGKRWVADEPVYLGQHRAMSIIWQPPTFEDETFKPKNWVTLVPQSMEHGRDAHATQAVLRVYLHPSSTAQAIWGKVQRNYARAFRAVPFWRYVGNSVLLVVLTTVGMLFSSTFVAYGLARVNWPGRTVAFVILLATMMLPAQVTMIPAFVIWRQLGWYNTLNPLWAPAFLGSAFFIFLMVQHMKTIPRELEESARIDGASALATWYYIILPQVKPAAAAIAIMTFMASWNEFMGPLIYLRDQAKFPLSLGLFGLRLEAMSDWSMIMAGNVLMTLPVVVIFFVCQRYFVQGMMMSGMKA